MSAGEDHSVHELELDLRCAQVAFERWLFGLGVLCLGFALAWHDTPGVAVASAVLALVTAARPHPRLAAIVAALLLGGVATMEAASLGVRELLAAGLVIATLRLGHQAAALRRRVHVPPALPRASLLRS
jgi:hypothetical protein